MSTSINTATMGERIVQIGGKTVGATATTLAALFGATLPGGNIVGWRIEGLTAAGAARLPLLWGDATAQAAYVPAGRDLDWGTIPVRDPAQIYLKRGSGADATDVVISVLHRIDGN